MADPKNVRTNPGLLYIAPIGTTEPVDHTAAWDAAWVPLGYTDEGPEFVLDQTFEDIRVAEELDPILTVQTARTTNINVAAAELTAKNLQIALNGGTIDTSGVAPDEVITFTPPAAGDVTHVMLGWDATDGLERWVFRKVINAASSTIPRRRAPQKAVIPLGFRVLVPDDGSAAWKMMHAADWA